MSERVTLDLPDDLYQRAQAWSARLGRPVGEVLSEAIRLTLVPCGLPAATIESLTDQEILALEHLALPEIQDGRLSELLALQQERELSLEESSELKRIMQCYQEALIRKSEGVKEAVRRGLRQPLHS